jgi:hypothetical protein
VRVTRTLQKNAQERIYAFDFKNGNVLADSAREVNGNYELEWSSLEGYIIAAESLVVVENKKALFTGKIEVEKIQVTAMLYITLSQAEYQTLWDDDKYSAEFFEDWVEEDAGNETYNLSGIVATNLLGCSEGFIHYLAPINEEEKENVYDLMGLVYRFETDEVWRAAGLISGY